MRAIDQSHRYGRHQAACREPEGSYDKTTPTAICCEHKTKYLIIRAPYTRIVVFWHISNIPPWFRRVKLVVIPRRFIQQQFLRNIAIQPAVRCYNSWANLRCSGCYPLGGKLLWNRSFNPTRAKIQQVSYSLSPLVSTMQTWWGWYYRVDFRSTQAGAPLHSHWLATRRVTGRRPSGIHWKCLRFWDTLTFNNSTDTKYPWMTQTHLADWIFISSV